MKKRYIILFLTAFLVASPVIMAHERANVEQAIKMSVGKEVQFEGLITEKLQGDNYVFWDGSGKIKLITMQNLIKDPDIDLEKKVMVLGTIKFDDKLKRIYIEAEKIENVKIIEEEYDIFNTIFDEGVRDIEDR